MSDNRDGKWTCGFGHTKGVDKHTTCSLETAEGWLMDDVDEHESYVDAMVNALIAKGRVTQGQFDALVSFCFNVGPGELERSTLLKKFRARDVAGAAAEFPRWVHAHEDGQPVIDPGLVKRRKAERGWFSEA